MENAADALKMAGFMLIFVAALSLAMTTLSKAKSAATAIIYSNNKRNDYTYIEVDDQEVDQTNRVVGTESIIPTIYKYRQESYRIEFYNSNGTPLCIVPTNITRTENPDNIDHDTIGGKWYVNFFDLAWESETTNGNQTRTLAQIEETVRTLQQDTRYKGKKFIEQIDEKETEEQSDIEDRDNNGEYITKDDEDKKDNKTRIISYTLKN